MFHLPPTDFENTQQEETNCEPCESDVNCPLEQVPLYHQPSSNDKQQIATGQFQSAVPCQAASPSIHLSPSGQSPVLGSDACLRDIDFVCLEGDSGVEFSLDCSNPCTQPPSMLELLCSSSAAASANLRGAAYDEDGFLQLQSGWFLNSEGMVEMMV